MLLELNEDSDGHEEFIGKMLSLEYNQAYNFPKI